jgi:hypothetical protein
MTPGSNAVITPLADLPRDMRLGQSFENGQGLRMVWVPGGAYDLVDASAATGRAVVSQVCGSGARCRRAGLPPSCAAMC